MRREKAMTKSVKRRITNILLFVILSLGAVLILFPIAWMLSTALKSAPEIAMYPPKLLPEKLMFENFAIAWSKAPFTRYTINTLIIVFFTIIGNVLVKSFVAYGFANIEISVQRDSGYYDDSRICYIGSHLRYFFQTAVGQYLSAVDRSGLLRKCLPYFHDASVLQDHSQ